MAVIQVTSREFRDKQKIMFDLADTGEKIIIRRGKKQAYVLVPIESTDFCLTPEAEERIKQHKDGELTK